MDALQQNPNRLPTVHHPDCPDSYQDFVRGINGQAGPGHISSGMKSISNPELPNLQPNQDQQDEQVDHWFNKYGKAILNDSMSGDEVAEAAEPLNVMKGKVSDVRGRWEQMGQVEERLMIRPRSNRPYRMARKPSPPVVGFVPMRSGGGFSTTGDKWKPKSSPNQFSYVRQYLMEQEEEERSLALNQQNPRLPMNNEESKNFSQTLNNNNLSPPTPAPSSAAPLIPVETVKNVVIDILKSKGINSELSKEELAHVVAQYNT